MTFQFEFSKPSLPERIPANVFSGFFQFFQWILLANSSSEFGEFFPRVLSAAPFGKFSFREPAGHVVW